MSRRADRRRGALMPTVSVVVLAALVGGAVVAHGFDTQRTTRTETSVWVTRDDGRYARVDTEVGQIDTVRQVADPTQVLQHGSTAVVVANGRRTLWAVDAADPVDLSAKEQTASGSTSAPDGVTAVGTAGDWVVYRTDSGGVWAGRLGSAGVAPPAQLQPMPATGAAAARYVAAAVAVDPAGTVAVYSSSEHAVRLLDAASGRLLRGPQAVASAPADDADLQMALVGGAWVLLDGSGKVWFEGHDGPVDAGTSQGAQLQQSATAGEAAQVADTGGLVSVSLRSGSVTRKVRTSGTPARPAVLDDGTVVAAWLATTSGSLWSSADGKVRPLAVEPGSLDQAAKVEPAISSNGGRAVVVEQATGQLWSVPDGRSISAQEWAPLDKSTTEVGTQQVDKVTEQLPPQALPDEFGVRAGTDVRLPVLLNDSDPNADDVLSVVPETLSALSDPAFGSLTLAQDDQLVVAHVRPGATGSATFTYQVTDGTASSAPVTVTLQVTDAGTDRPPAWCPVTGCTQRWPSVDVAPGGTARVGLLDSWVDPDGDPFVLQGAVVEEPGAPVRVVVDSEGTLTVQHTDPNGTSGSYHVTVTVTDSRGQHTARTLEVHVAAAPALTLSSVAVVIGRSSPGTVTVRDHVTSGSGSYRLVDAVATGASADRLTVVPDAKDGTLSVAAAAAGQYRLTYTVQDLVTGEQQTAVVRVRCADGAGTVVLAPAAAYVRDHEDTTVDVLAAVRSTTDHVLMVAAATSDEPALGVDVVDAALVRLRGTTADGQPGAVGTVTVTVTDGADLTTTGTITVFLVPSTTGRAPIAVPDAVTARVGTQVDVPVADNDVAPDGERLVVRDVVGSGAAGELAFASGADVRYLAPTTPGTYVVDYVVALATDAEATATASLTVTVLPAGTDRAPVPAPLEARVAVGGSVRVPVERTGTDPDGDAVTVVSVTQPAAGQGSAEVSAAGDAIGYQAPSTLTTGDQVSFTYTVRDPSGALGTATVRVGVLPASSANVPVAYTDRVRVRAGAPAVTVRPLLNDRDPSGGTLTLVALRPDAPTTAGDPEAARLQSLVDPSTSLADGTVTLDAGSVLGTHAYVYTVQSAGGSTAEGLIVLEVVDTAVVEQPVVTDTVLTATDRQQLAGAGVDVVSGKVSWTAGEASGLHLSVWGAAAARYTVDGGRIHGALPAGGELVPFTLEGKDRAGQAVRAYGFLRIPAFDDMRVGLRPGIQPVRVDEGGQVDVDVRQLVDLAPGDGFEVDAATDHRVQRPAAACRSAGTSTVRYTAGNGAPWTDSCLVSVRITGQQTWTDLVVPLVVAPASPQAVLTPVSRTVAPGTSQTIDLLTLVSWEGGRVGDASALVFTVGAGTPDVAVQQSGSSVTVEASARAVPGARSTVQVRVAQYGGLTSSIEVVVGQAAQDGPRGATLPASCSVGDGSGCTVQVVGVSGEYDPFAGKPGGGLTLDRVGDTTTAGCAVAAVTAADARSVRVTWPGGAKAAGGTCKVPFTVADAQGRLGSGLLDLDLLGYPAPPASLSLQAYTGTSVTVDVVLGPAAAAHPSVTGAAIYEGSARLSDACQPSGSAAYRCTVSGLTNGERHELTARVRNSVGESDPTTSLSAWAYAAPSTVQADARAVYVPGRTTTADGVVDLDLSAGDDVATFLLVDQSTGARTVVTRSGATTTARLDLSPGPHTVAVTPSSRYVPPSGAADSSGGTQTVVVQAAGAPRVSPGQVTVTGTSLTVGGATLDANGSPSPTSLVYVLSDTGVVECRADGDGALVPPHGSVVQSSPTFTGLTDDTRYWVTVCGSNGFGAAGASPAPDGSVVFAADAPTVRTGYSVAADPTHSGSTYSWTSVTAPVVSARPGTRVEYSTDDGATWSPTFSLKPTGVPQVLVRQCSRSFSGRCSDSTQVPAATGSAKAPVAVTVSATCSATDAPFSLSSGSSTGRATTSAAAGTGTVTWTLHWVDGGPYQGLTDLTTTCTLTAATPTPTPTPTP